jgi:hypothetical protein
MTAKTMTDEDLRAITAASAGLRGLFVHMPATGSVAFSPRDTDELHTIAEDLEPHVAEPLVVMLDGVPRLLAEVERLRARQQVHLAQIASLSQSAPLPEELQGWESARAALVAEVGTLRAQVAEADRDAEAAAGGLPIPLGEMPAGSTTRKLVIANRLLIHERDRVTVTAGGWKRAFIEMRRRRDAARLEVLQLGADLDSMAARETAPLRAEIERLTQEERKWRHAGTDGIDRMADHLGRAQGEVGRAVAEIARLRAELESLAPHARDTETEPDAEVLAAPVRCDCCSVAIPAGDSAVKFVDEQGRACWAHYGRCPEPDRWHVEWKLGESPRWASPDVWILGRWPAGDVVAEPYEDARNIALVVAAGRDIARVRLVRVRKEVTP